MTLEHAATGKAFNDGCTVAYRLDGPPAGAALLLSNSLGSTADMWAEQVAPLALRFRVIRYDTRGHGESDAPGGDYTIDQLGRDALAVLDAVGAQRAHVCGLSLGGVTGMWLGVHAPARVRSLVLTSTAARVGTVQMWNDRIGQVRTGGTESIADAVMARWFTDSFRSTRPDTVSTYRAMLASCSADGYAGCCAALRDADLREDILQITAPTLVIAGESDPATPPSDGEAIRSRINGAKMVTLHASHLANVEQPEAFNENVLTFIAQRDRIHG